MHTLIARTTFLALFLLMTTAIVSAGEDENDGEAYAKSKGITVIHVSNEEWEDANTSFGRDIADGTLDGIKFYRHVWYEETDKATGKTTITVSLDGKSFTTNDEDEAERWTIRQIDEILNGLTGGQKETGTPAAPQARVADFVFRDVLMTTVVPRSVGRIEKQKTEFKANAPVALAKMTTVNTSWASSHDSALRFENMWFKSGYEARRFGGSLHGSFNWDRFSLDVILPVDRVTYDKPFTIYDYTRAGLVLAPRYNLVSQESGPFDLSLGFTGFFLHSFLDERSLEDPQHAGGGPMMSVTKDFEKFTFSLGTLWIRGYDANGQETGAGGRKYTDMISTGMQAGIPIGERMAVNLSLTHSHTLRLSENQDSDYFTAGIGINYVVKDAWLLDLTLRRNLGLEQVDNIEAHIGLGWKF